MSTPSTNDGKQPRKRGGKPNGATLPNGHDKEAWEVHGDKLRAGHRVKEEPPAERKAPIPKPKWPKPFPGVMAQTVKAVLDASPKPRRDLATLSVLVALASSIPGTIHGRGGMRSGLYATATLPTMGGKDMPRVAAEFIHALTGLTAEGKPASGSAMDELVQAWMPSLMTIDEVAHLLLASKSKEAPAYLRDLQASKLKLWSAGMSAHLIRKHASGGRKPKVEENRRVPHPNFSMLSFSTPETMASALSSASVSTGDVPRELFMCDETKVEQRWPKVNGFVPPQLLIDRALVLRGLIEDIRQCAEGSDKVLKMVREVSMTPQATALLEALMRRYSMDEDETNLTGRHWEKVFRVALTVAVWDNPGKPLMRVRHVVWAEALVTASDRSVIAYFAGRVHDDQRVAEVEKVRVVVARLMHGKEQITWSEALKRSKLYAPQFAQAIAHLADIAEVEVQAVEVGKQRPLRYLVRGSAWGD